MASPKSVLPQYPMNNFSIEDDRQIEGLTASQAPGRLLRRRPHFSDTQVGARGGRLQQRANRRRRRGPYLQIMHDVAVVEYRRGAGNSEVS